MGETFLSGRTGGLTINTVLLFCVNEGFFFCSYENGVSLSFLFFFFLNKNDDGGRKRSLSPSVSLFLEKSNDEK